MSGPRVRRGTGARMSRPSFAALYDRIHIMGSDLLWHYTNSGGLLGIIESKELWATNALFLNDSEELHFGIDMICDELLKIEKDVQLREGCDGATRHLRNFHMNIFVSHLRLHHSFENALRAPYVSCLSRARDDLNQWRGYGRNGVSIGFDHRELIDGGAVPEHLAAPSPVEVQYGESARLRARKAARLIHRRVSEVISILAKDNTNVATIGANDFKKYSLPALLASPYMKHSSFESENEVRLVYVGDVNALRYRADHAGIIPYSAIPIRLESLREIIVSPGPNAELRAAAIRSMASSKGLGVVSVVQSQCPFRG